MLSYLAESRASSLEPLPRDSFSRLRERKRFADFLKLFHIFLRRLTWLGEPARKSVPSLLFLSVSVLVPFYVHKSTLAFLCVKAVSTICVWSPTRFLRNRSGAQTPCSPWQNPNRRRTPILEQRLCLFQGPMVPKLRMVFQWESYSSCQVVNFACPIESTQHKQ